MPAAILILALLAAALLVQPVSAQPDPRTAIKERFIIGASYQGPADRAWRGDYWAWWAEDLFDASLVDQDFQRASQAGLNTLRIFVQLELLRQIRRGDWSRLDAVVDLAEQRGHRLIVTLGDYDELRVAEVARVSGLIAQRYAGRAGILAYDLGNEPSVWGLQKARYPGPTRPPMQSSVVLDAYGVRASREYVDAFRLSEDGRHGPQAVPGWMTADEVFVYHNTWIYSTDLAGEAAAWSAATGEPQLAYFETPQAARWQPLIQALDQTLRAWIEPRLQAIRQADPTRPITIGHHDPLLMMLPANRLLDFQSPHFYPPPDAAGLDLLRRSLQRVKARFPDQPIILGEFGVRSTEPGEDAAAIYESAVWLAAALDGHGGGLKWMLTDSRGGTDSMGLYDVHNQPKALARFGPALPLLVRNPRSLETGGNATTALCIVYQAAAANASGGLCDLTDRAAIRSNSGTLAALVTGNAGSRLIAASAADVLVTRPGAGPQRLTTAPGSWLPLP
ncbi:MAG: hypothetical protein U0821_27020 [Chloroflexota bacterium]